MTVPVPSNNVRNINRQPDQESAYQALDDCTGKRLPGGLAYKVPDQDDSSLGSNNPADFGPLPTHYITCNNLSSILPHINHPQRNHPPTMGATT